MVDFLQGCNTFIVRFVAQCYQPGHSNLNPSSLSLLDQMLRAHYLKGLMQYIKARNDIW